MRTIPSTPITDRMNNWFLSGLFWDIVDNSPETNSTRVNGMTGTYINNIVDGLQIGNMNSLTPIYNQMTSSTTNALQLKSKLLSTYPAKKTQINQLFTINT